MTRTRRATTVLLLLLGAGAAAVHAAAVPRVLYLEGAPRWEMTFLRRALGESDSLRLVVLAQMTEELLVRYGVEGPGELRDGFPKSRAGLSRYSLVVLGSVEAGALMPAQHQLLVEYVRSGGSLLLLGGRHALAEGGWGETPLAAMLPVRLGGEVVGSVEPVEVEVFATPRGMDEPGLDLGDRILGGLVNLPALKVENRIAGLAADARVLVSAYAPDGIEPMLVVREEGEGRVAVWRTADTWSWQMRLPREDATHEVFWRRLFGWLAESSSEVAEDPPRRPPRPTPGLLGDGRR